MGPEVLQDLWLVGDNYKLSSAGERFSIEAEGAVREVAARRVSCIMLDGNGAVTSAALLLASRWRIPVVLLGERLSTIMWTKPEGYVELVLSQAEVAKTPMKNEIAGEILKASRENARQALRYWFRDACDQLEAKLPPEELLKEVWPDHLTPYVYLKKLLVARVLADVVRAGLMPSIGFINSGANALAQDIAMEFEGAVPFYQALKLVYEGANLDVGEASGRREAARLMQERLEHKVATTSGREAQVRAWVVAQVKSLARTLTSKVVAYRAFSWRP